MSPGSIPKPCVGPALHLVFPASTFPTVVSRPLDRRILSSEVIGKLGGKGASSVALDEMMGPKCVRGRPSLPRRPWAFYFPAGEKVQVARLRSSRTELPEKSALIKPLTQHNKAESHFIWFLPRPRFLSLVDTARYPKVRHRRREPVSRTQTAKPPPASVIKTKSNLTSTPGFAPPFPLRLYHRPALSQDGRIE